MHDDLLERRLRTALRDEADRMPFTITAAELERRVILRGRGAGNKRLGMLLAAAMGVGLIGVGSVIGGLTNPPVPPPISQSTDAAATDPAATAAATAPADALLPSMDNLIAAAGADPVVIAQSHGPADGPDPELAYLDFGGSSSSLGDVGGPSRFVLAYGCLGEGEMHLDVRVPGSRGPQSGPTAPCDGAMHEEAVVADGPRSVSLVTTDPASWRVLVRRLDGAGPGPSAVLPFLQPGDHEESLIDRQGMTVQSGGPVPTDHCCRFGTLILENIGAMPGRFDYRVQLTCTPGGELRYIHGDDIAGRFVARTITQVDCDGLVHAIGLGIPEPYGTRVFVAAARETVWSVLVTSELPPVALVRDRSGYQFAGGAGPSYAFETHSHAYSGIGTEEAGPIIVVLACMGSEPIEVTVRLGSGEDARIETFRAGCTAEAALTEQTFEANGVDVGVEYVAPKGSWSAMTILAPAALP
jgi:hypothetical protein